MDFTKEEQEILQLIETQQIKNPPKEFLDGFEFEVKQRLALPPESASTGIPVAAGVLVLLLAFGLIMLHYVQTRRISEEKAKTENVTVVDKPLPSLAATAPVVVSEEEKFKKLSHELFILEMLGEDEGLHDNVSSVASDVNFIIQPGQTL